MEQLLEKLFESIAKVRLLRLFLRNTEESFTFQALVKRTQLRPGHLRKELGKLLKVGLAKSKTATFKEEIQKRSHSKRKPPKISFKIRKAKVFYANPEFKLLKELRDLLIKASVAPRAKLLRQVKGLGNIKLCVVSGVFLGSDNSRIDLLLVCDNVKKRKLDKFLSGVESEIGKALRYTVMDTNEFKYRLDMYDRFLRDILEYPHEKLVNKVHL